MYWPNPSSSSQTAPTQLSQPSQPSQPKPPGIDPLRASRIRCLEASRPARIDDPGARFLLRDTTPLPQGAIRRAGIQAPERAPGRNPGAPHRPVQKYYHYLFSALPAFSLEKGLCTCLGVNGLPDGIPELFTDLCRKNPRLRTGSQTGSRMGSRIESRSSSQTCAGTQSRAPDGPD